MSFTPYKGHAMTIKQLWSNCFRIVFPKRVKTDIQLFTGFVLLTYKSANNERHTVYEDDILTTAV